MSKVQVIRYIRCLIFIMILALCNIYPLNAEVIVQSVFETDCQNFGYSQALSNNKVIIGCPSWNSEYSSCAYIYGKIDNEWKQEAILKSDEHNDNFGYSVAISNDTAIVGSRYNTAYFFQKEGAHWIKNKNFSLPFNDHTYQMSVAILDNISVIGASYEHGSESDSVYVFRKNDNEWIITDQLIPDIKNAGNRFGSQVSISKNYIFVGTPNNNDQGIVYIYKKNNENKYSLIQILSDDSYNKHFAYSHSNTDNYAVVGSNGLFYIFENNNDKWILMQQIQLFNRYYNYLIQSVSISNNNLITMGDPYDHEQYGDYFFKHHGAVYIFKLNQNNQWEEYSKFSGGKEKELNFGSNVSLNETTAIISTNKKQMYIIENIDNKYTISGHTKDSTNTPIKNVEFYGTDLNSTFTDELGYYSFQVPFSWDGRIIMKLCGNTYRAKEYADVRHHFVNEDYTINIYSVSGYISDNANSPISGVKIALKECEKFINTNSLGFYSFDLFQGISEIIRPEGMGFSYIPHSMSYENINQNFFDQNFTGQHLTISGFIYSQANYPVSNITLYIGNDVVKTNENGFYSIDLSYEWSGIITPEKNGVTFNPEFLSYTQIDDSHHNQNFIAHIEEHRISGVIKDTNNNVLPNIILAIDNNEEITTDNNGEYSFNASHLWSGTITPIKQGFNFIPPSRTYTQMISPKESQNYIGSNQQFNILGKIVDNQNAPMSGIKIHVDDIIYVTDESGFIKLTLPYGWQGKIQPNRTGYGFEPQYYEISNLSENKSDMNFKAKLLTFKIAGQLTDNANQPVSNISILVNNGVGTTITDNNGYYQKDVPFGWSGMIIPQSTNVTFNPAFYSHMIVVQDLINQNFIASGTPLPFEKPEWIVDETQFQYQQTITAIVNQSQNDWSIHDGDILAAFANTTCRGVSAPVETSPKFRKLILFSSFCISFKFE